MRVAIIIPTYDRIPKLERCLKSLENQSYKNFEIIVYCDNNDKKTYEHLRSRSESYGFLSGKGCVKKFHTYLNEKQEFVIGSWNKFFNMAMKEFPNYFDAFLWCVDDVELYPNCLHEAVKCMESNYPDLDGVVGLKQECPGRPDYTFKYYGQCLIGKKFVERYKEVDYMVSNPSYKHFYQDEELWIYASSQGLFRECESAILKHYHPAFISSEIDETHPLVRGAVKRHDDYIYKIRREKDLVWGKSWEITSI